MPDSPKLSRTFSLRLSEEEYARLKNAYQTQGARSLAELAREAMQRMIDSPVKADALNIKVTELDEQVQELARTVEQHIISTK